MAKMLCGQSTGALVKTLVEPSHVRAPFLLEGGLLASSLSTLKHRLYLIKGGI